MTTKNKTQYKKSAKDNWWFWRLVLEEKFSYDEVSKMTADEIMEANAALDIYIEKIEEKNKSK